MSRPSVTHEVLWLIDSLRLNIYIYLYNNTPSKAIVNANSNITYIPLIEADDTGR